MNLKRKIDSDCNFQLLSLLFHYPNNFLVGSLSLYPCFPQYIPPTQNTGPKICFLILQLGAGKIPNFLVTFCIGVELISFLGEGAQAIFFQKAINDQSCKLKNRRWQNYLFHVYMPTFLTFSRELSVSDFFICLGVHSISQKSVYYCLVITL